MVSCTIYFQHSTDHASNCYCQNTKMLKATCYTSWNFATKVQYAVKINCASQKWNHKSIKHIIRVDSMAKKIHKQLQSRHKPGL